IANCICSLVLMGPVDANGISRVADFIASITHVVSWFDLRHAGLALSTSLAATVNLVLLLRVLRRRIGALGAGQLIPSFARSLAASLAMVPAVRWVAGLAAWVEPGHLRTRVAVLMAAVAVGIFVFAAVAVLLGSSEAHAVKRLVRERLARRAMADAAQP